MQLGHLITKLQQPPVHAAMEHLLLVLRGLTTTVSQDTPFLRMVLTHCGIVKFAVELSKHAVIPQTWRGSTRSYLNLPQMTWSSISVGMSLTPMRTSLLILLNSTYSDP